jgi:hypothetical protein
MAIILTFGLGLRRALRGKLGIRFDILTDLLIN